MNKNALYDHQHCHKSDFIPFSDYYSTADMDDIFIHSPVDGCLGCFHVLAAVNSAAMNIEGAFAFLN